MRLKLVSCDVLHREASAAIARSPHSVDIEFVPMGLHDQGCQVMLSRLQEMVDAVDPAYYAAILLGYGLCGNGTVGLVARWLPIVIPRVHDCINLMMGSRKRYVEYFKENPGVYFRSTGWLERSENIVQMNPGVLAGRDLSRWVSLYGEENGQYLFDQFSSYMQRYRQLTFIQTGLEPDAHFESQAREEAAQRGWQFEKIHGDLGMLERLVCGPWDNKEFLIVRPGQRVVARYDDEVFGTEEAG